MLRLSWLISMGISLFGAMIIEHFFTISPEGQAGNGNFGAIGIALVIPFFLLSLFATYRFAFQGASAAKDKMMRWILVVFGFALLIGTIYYVIDFKNATFIALGGDTKTPGSTIYGYPLLNQYTNHIFINFYTFAAVHLVSALFGGVVGIFKPVKIAEPEDVEENL